MRACPRCAAPLAPEARDNALAGILGPIPLHVDACARCGGVFLDREEFGHLTGNVALERWLASIGHTLHDGVPCPACNGVMATRAASGVVVDGRDAPVERPTELGSVVVDACGRCGGLWFDGGEVDRLRDARAPELDRV